MTILAAVVTVAAVWPHPALSQAAARGASSEAATITAVAGGAELQRASGGSWQLAVVGSMLFTGDKVRTRPNSRLKLVFQDDSLVDFGPATELLIAQQVSEATAGQRRSSLDLVAGRIRALVGEDYRTPGSRYEIQTPTAVASVQGAEFVVQYDSTAEHTDVVGIAGEVRVEGRLGVVGGGVQVGPQTVTRVQRGRFPSVPRRMDEALVRQYLEGLDIVGTGGRDSLGSGHAAVKGTLLSPSDSATAVAGQPAQAASAPATAPGGLIVGAPDEPVAARLSRDVYTNTQPLFEYRLRPPGQRLSGSGAMPARF